MLSSSPLAEQALADDIAACSEDDAVHPEDDDFCDAGFPTHGHGMYRRPSGVAYGGARPVFNQPIDDEPILTLLERKQSRNAERSLLRDNHVLPPKHAFDPKKKPSLGARIYRRLFSTKLPPTDEEETDAAARRPTETSPLLNGAHVREYAADGDSGSADSLLEEQWEGAVASGRLRTTWQRETKTIVSYSAPNGHYAVDVNAFNGTGFDRGPLHIPAGGAVYRYGSGFPSGSSAHNFWVDVYFLADS